MKTNNIISIISLLLLISLLIVGIYYFKSSQKYKDKVKQQELIIDSLVVEKGALLWEIDSLYRLEPEIRWRYKNTKKKLKEQQDETDEIPGNVSTYSNSKLDSILTNHRHRQRPKDTDSINN